jgi:hypothetical protein
MATFSTPSAIATAGALRVRAGFTLFEVCISLMIVAIGVLSVLILLPAGLKAQQLARFQLYAAAKAEEMVECFVNTHNANPAIDTEAFEAWDVPVSYRSQAWDLESRVATHRFGVLPLPLDLGRRLDSDNDEIQRILAEGGYLYYSQPMATTNIEEQAMAAAPPSEAQKLVFTVTGYAQANAMPLFPWKAWPYEMPYPSPPLHGLHYDQFLTPGSLKFNWRGASNCWEGTTVAIGASLPGADDDIKPVWQAYKTYCYDNAPTEANAIAYVQAALLYCQKKGLDATFYDPSPIPAPVPAFNAGTLDAAGNDAGHVAWKQVNAMRFLAHAATCMTRWQSSTTLAGGVSIPSGGGSPSLTLTHDKILYYHERCLNLIMRFSASFPYDWAVPRPLQRATMMDYPLIEYDLFSPPRSGKVWEAAGGTVDACQWRPVTGQPVRNIGLSWHFPDHPIPDGSDAGSSAYAAFWGDASHFTLTKPFDAAERCREIVFWTVDWQAFEDFETAPSAPVDASKYPFQAPMANKRFRDRMENVDFRDEQLYSYRNPEKVLLFTRPTVGLATGTDTSGMEVLNNPWQYNPDRGDGAGHRETFSGLYGADRNFNKRLDRGPLPRSTRLKAVQVARFNYYDPRLVVIAR